MEAVYPREPTRPLHLRWTAPPESNVRAGDLYAQRITRLEPVFIEVGHGGRGQRAGRVAEGGGFSCMSLLDIRPGATCTEACTGPLEHARRGGSRAGATSWSPVVGATAARDPVLFAGMEQPLRAPTRHGPRARSSGPRASWVTLFFLLAVAPGAADAQRTPTTQTSIGLFYQPGAPDTASLWREGDQGQRLQLLGRVLDVRGRPVAGALVELWHANWQGDVDESRYRAAQRSADDGRFGIRTVLPGHIEMARYNATFAPRHIHISVSHPDHPRLISLIFFKGDERLQGTPYPELAIPLETAPVDDGKVLIGEVEIVLGAEPLPEDAWRYGD